MTCGGYRRHHTKMPKQLNIADVARAAGVSTTTVSRVLNRVPTVTTENRAKVEAAVRQLNFRPNVAARRLAAGRQQTTLGLIIPEFQEVFQSFYAIEVIKGVGRASQEHHVDLLLHLASENKREPNIQAVDGLIFVDVYGQEEFLDRMLGERMPCIVLNHYLDELPVSCIAVDNALGAKQAVDFLVGLGHREIATIAGDLGTQVGLDRLDGYVRAMRSHNLTVKQSYIQRADDYSPAAARRAATKLLSLDDRPTALFVASDEMALAAIDVAQSKNLRVPEDLSIVGFDDNPVAVSGTIPLTTIFQPLRDMASQGIAVLMETMQGKRRAPLKVRLPTKLIERQSCRQTWLPR